VLQDAGLVARRRSEGDGRRSYVTRTALCDKLVQPHAATPSRVAFICSQNSARSQLAEHYWRTVSRLPVVSGGTHPAERVHPRAVEVGRRHGLDLTAARPRLAADVLTGEELVVTVCDRAYEDLGSGLHWSVPDPALAEAEGAFEVAYDEIATRITRLAAAFEKGTP
jgi:protein-tyrosine-phosphatase